MMKIKLNKHIEESLRFEDMEHNKLYQVIYSPVAVCLEGCIVLRAGENHILSLYNTSKLWGDSLKTIKVKPLKDGESITLTQSIDK